MTEYLRTQPHTHRPFNPHITVCKLSKLARAGAGGKRGRRGGKGHSSRAGVAGGGQEDNNGGRAVRAGQDAAAGHNAEANGEAAGKAHGYSNPEAMELDVQEEQGGEDEQLQGGGAVVSEQQPGDPGVCQRFQCEQQKGLDMDAPQQQQQGSVADGEQHLGSSNEPEPMGAVAVHSLSEPVQPCVDSRSMGAGNLRWHEEGEEHDECDGPCNKRPKREEGEAGSTGTEERAALCAAAAIEGGQPSSSEHTWQPTLERRAGQTEGQSKDAMMEQLQALRQQRKAQRHERKQQKRQQRQQQQQGGHSKGEDEEEDEGEEEPPPREPKIRSIPVEAYAELRELDAGVSCSLYLKCILH